MTLETLLLLQRCLHSQQLTVGDPTFSAVARQVLVALDELAGAIASRTGGAPPVPPTDDPTAPVPTDAPPPV